MFSGSRQAIVIVPSLLRTAAGDSGGSNLQGGPGRVENVVKLIITAISGAGATLNLLVEHSDTGTGGWTTIDTFPAQTATTTGVTRSVPTPAGGTKAYTRVSWTITGTTPQITFSVTSALTEPLMLVGG